MWGVCVGLFGVMIYLTPLGLALEEKFGLYGLFHLRGTVPAPHDVMVVAIDQSSATQLNLPIKPNLWPHSIHARLIEQLTDAGARVIAFDLIFDTPGKMPEHDVQLAAAMKQARNVVVVERLNFEKSDLFIDQVDPVNAGMVKEGSARLMPIIADAVLAHAPFPLPRASRVNTYWTFKASAGDIPTLPVVALQIFTLPIYDDFVRLLRKTSPENVARLSIHQDSLNIDDAIFTLRNIFVSAPHIARQMLTELTHDTSLDHKEKRMIQALIKLYAGDEIRHLNFFGPPRSVQTVPYHQILTEQIAEYDFKDKAVFVGFSAATQPEQDRIRDDYHTVFSNADGLFISGVEIAATAFANLLDDRPVRPLSWVGSFGVLFLLGFSFGFIFLLLPNRIATVAGVVLIIIYAGIAVYQFQVASIWLPLVTPLLLQMPLALFGAVLLKYIAAKRERAQLKDAFGYFLPERVVNDIAKNAGPIISNNQLVYGTCLATDAEKYTALAEKMDPQQLSQLMNDYYTALFEPVRQHQGIVSDVVGDAMLAIWASPTANSDLRKQACLACLDISDAVERFNQGSNRPPLPTRIGLHFGEMLLGHIGALRHYEYRAVGNIVNTANRIQGANKYLGTRLLLSSEVVAGLDEFLTRPLGNFLLAGKSDPVNLAELVTRKQQASSEQLWLCETFTSALHAYQLQQWYEACEGFTEILKVLPTDGPAQFFLEYCQNLIHQSPTDLWSATIHLASK